MSKQHSQSFSRGFDHGNFGNAYESTDWESWLEALEEEYQEENAEPFPSGTDEREFRAGLLLGFFSSYEIEEIPIDLADEVAALRAEYGEEP